MCASAGSAPLPEVLLCLSIQTSSYKLWQVQDEVYCSLHCILSLQLQLAARQAAGAPIHDLS